MVNREIAFVGNLTAGMTHELKNVLAIIDANGTPITADTAETTAGPGILEIVFEIASGSLSQYNVVSA